MGKNGLRRHAARWTPTRRTALADQGGRTRRRGQGTGANPSGRPPTPPGPGPLPAWLRKPSPDDDDQETRTPLWQPDEWNPAPRPAA